jgi:hypothetical protein
VQEIAMRTDSHTSSGRSQQQRHHTSTTTTNHETIRRWAQQRGGKPAAVKDTSSADDVGILRIDFPGYSGAESLQEITWDEFFEKFEAAQLALVFQEETADGKLSNFNKFVKRV